MLVMSTYLSAQTDSLNLQKYWKLRHDFVENFVKIGSGPGESLPATAITPMTCVDNVSQWANVEYGGMHWGDGVLRQGHYLGFLATEYALKKKYGLPLDGIRVEIYYALEAINRLDRSCEPMIEHFYFDRPFYRDTLNGFYLRDDIPEGFVSNWSDHPMNLLCQNAVNAEFNNAAKVNDPEHGLIYRSSTSYQNVPSLDQMTSVVVGLLMVHYLVEDDFVQPMPRDQGFALKSEAYAIMDRMIAYAAERNWQLIDVNGWPVGNGGGDIMIAAPAFLQMMENILGKEPDYNQRIIRRMQYTGSVQLCYTGFGVETNPTLRAQACKDDNPFALSQKKAWIGLENAVPPGKLNNANTSVFQDWMKGGWIRLNVNRFRFVWTRTLPNKVPQIQSDILSDGYWSGLPWPLSKILFEEEPVAHYNNTIMFNLGVVSGLWDSAQVHLWGNVTENRQLELINCVLTGEKPVKDKSFYQKYLNSMPQSGPYYFTGANCCPSIEKIITVQNGGWGSEHRWTRPEESFQGGGVEGIFPGIDYMYFHNLYYLLFADELPAFREETDCFCEKRIQEIIPEDSTGAYKDAVQNLNRKLAHVSTCPDDVFFQFNHQLNRHFTLAPRFPEYAEWGISTVRYQSEDVRIGAQGSLELQSKLIFTNGAGIEIQDGGSVVINRGTLLIDEGSWLELKGEMYVDPGATLELKAGSRIRLHPSARVVIDEKAVLKLADNTFIQISEGAAIDNRNTVRLFQE